MALPLIRSLLLKEKERTKEKGRFCVEAGGYLIKSVTYGFLIFVLGGAASHTPPADRIQEIKE